MTPTWNDLDNRRSRWVTIMGRLKPGVTADAAEVQLNVVYKQVNEQEIQALTDVSDAFRQRFVTKHLEVLTPAAASPTCGTVLDAARRAHVHGRGRAADCLRQRRQPAARPLDVAAERNCRSPCARRRSWPDRPATPHRKPVLAGAGGIVGLALAMWTGRLLLAALPGDPATQTLGQSGCCESSASRSARRSSLRSSLASVRRSRRHGPAVVTALKDEAGSVVGGGRQARVRRGLVVGQVALSMLLLAGAGLFARSLFNLRRRRRLSSREPADLLDRSDAERLRCGADAVASSSRPRMRWPPFPACAARRCRRLVPSLGTSGAGPSRSTAINRRKTRT